MPSDNTVLNPGTGGDTIRTDDIGGVKHPTSKITVGADGVDDGFVSDSNPMPTKPRTMAWNAPQQTSVGVATTLVLSASVNRKGALFVNDSANVIYLGLGAAAVVGRGVRLNPAGGSYEISAENLTTQQINAISTAAGSNLAAHEAV